MHEIAVLFYIILLAVALIALFLVVRLLFPGRIKLTQKAADDMFGRAFILGLINTLFFAALILGLMALGESAGVSFLFLPAFILLVSYIAALMYGLTGIVHLVGARLVPEQSPNRQSILGAAVLILGCLAPFVGWFGLFFVVSFLGLGAFIISFFRKDVRMKIDSE